MPDRITASRPAVHLPRQVFFSVQPPAASIRLHSDGNNFILNGFVPLRCPPGGRAWLSVGAERRGWEDGVPVVIDASVMHSTANEGDRPRFLLNLRFWHPGLTGPERRALRYAYEKGAL